MISKEDVEHIAKLARIQLTEQEVRQFQKDFTAILAYFENMNAVDVSHVSPMTHAGTLVNAQREDRVEEKDAKTTASIVAQFPEKEKDYLKVQSILSKKK